MSENQDVSDLSNLKLKVRAFIDQLGDLEEAWLQGEQAEVLAELNQRHQNGLVVNGEKWFCTAADGPDEVHNIAGAKQIAKSLREQNA
jgi:hypothetical protein